MGPEPEKEHEWLHRLLGEWDFEVEWVMAPGASPARVAGSESVRSLGGLWILAEGRHPMPGGKDAVSLMALGYDLRRGCFVGTRVGSMTTHLFVHEGALDVERRVLTLEADGPDFTHEAGTTRYRGTIEITSDDTWAQTTSVRLHDGTWHQFMTMRYQRRGAAGGSAP